MLRHKNFSGTSTTTSCYYIYNVIWCYIIRASLVLLLQLQAPSFIYIIYIYTYIIVYIYIYITCCYVIRTSLVLLQQLHAKLCIYIYTHITWCYVIRTSYALLLQLQLRAIPYGHHLANCVTKCATAKFETSNLDQKRLRSPAKVAKTHLVWRPLQHF